MAIYHVDLTNGNDAAAGTLAAPFRTFAPVNAGLWAGNEIQVMRGGSAVLNAATRANIDAAAAGLLTVYGDAAAPLPVLDGGAVNHNPLWVRNAPAGYTVERMHVAHAPGHGLAVSAIAGGSNAGVTVRDCIVSENGLSGAFGVDGLTVGLSVLDGGMNTDIRLERIQALNNGGHGIKFRGNVLRGIAIDCAAHGNGTLSPSHGLGSSGQNVWITRQAWTQVGTAGGSPVWERAVSGLLLSSVTAWLGATVGGAGPTHYQLSVAAAPAAPLPGEIGIGGPNTVRVNVSGLDPSTLEFICCYSRPSDVMFLRPKASGTLDANGVEGQGIYMDNGSHRCRSMFGESWGNAGEGYFLNDALECGHYGGRGWGNGKGAAGALRSVGGGFHGMELDAGGLGGIRFSTGCKNMRALRNTVRNATVGVSSNDAGTNSITEDWNTFVACTLDAQGIATRGGRSVVK